MPVIEFQEIYRDSIQSLFGTNPSAKEIVSAHPNLTKTGVASAQIAGGTFFDIMAKKGRNPVTENQALFKAFANNRDGVDISALFRGDFLVGYEPYSYDVIKAFVQEMAQIGLTQIQNFHGLNDTRLQEAIAQACKEVREEKGLEIWPQGAICIENNVNITIESCMQAARELKAQGHKGFYLKSASGVVDPDFVKELTQKLAEAFPEDKIGVHVHATYGRAEACYLAAAEGARQAELSLKNKGKETSIRLQMDVAHPALAGNTGHPSMTQMRDLIAAHSESDIAAAAPVLNEDAIKADTETLRDLRLRYRDYETVIDPDLLEIMERARVPGGASSTLKGIPHLVSNMKQLLGTDDWTEIQKAVYLMQAEILPDLGDPTQVTPYAANTTGQAGLSLFNVLSEIKNDPSLLNGFGPIIDAQNGKVNVDTLQSVIRRYKDDFAFKTLYGGLDGKSATVAYLCGAHGQVPPSVNPDLQQKAFAQMGVDKAIDFVPAREKAPALKATKEAIVNASRVETHDKMWDGSFRMKPTVSKVTPFEVTAAALLPDGVAQVIDFKHGKNKPQDIVKLPTVMQFRKGLVDCAGGAAHIQGMVENALLVHAIDRGHYDRVHSPDTVARWREQALRAFVQADEGITQEILDTSELSGCFVCVQERDKGRVRSQIAGLIKEAIDNRCAGLYDEMKEKMIAMGTLSCSVDAGIVSSYALGCGRQLDVDERSPF